jgi:acetoin utilization deacetylase AcuC-like enzyme
LHVFSDPASGRHVNSVAWVEAPERFPAALAGVEAAEKAGVTVEWRPCRPAPEAALLAVHDPHYLREIESLCAAGGGHLGPDTGVGPRSWESALLASGAACGAVESALSGTAAFAVVRPPGHHAGRATAMGFCLLNHAAIAAEHARTHGARAIAILDWDVHHGNGTQDLFYADGEVLYLSVHQSPFYPGTGSAREVGEGRGRGFTANVPLPYGSTEEDYAAAFTGVFLPVLREFRPELVIVSAGYDAHAADLLGGMRLTAASYGRFAAALADLAREIGAAPPALVMEGGYDLGALAACIAATMEGVERARPLAPEDRGGAGSVEKSRDALAPFWESLR